MRRMFVLVLVLFGAWPAWSHSEVDARNRVSFPEYGPDRQSFWV